MYIVIERSNHKFLLHSPVDKYCRGADTILEDNGYIRIDPSTIENFDSIRWKPKGPGWNRLWTKDSKVYTFLEWRDANVDYSNCNWPLEIIVEEIGYIKSEDETMPDIINGLTQRRSKLVARRTQLEKDYQSELSQINRDIEVINQAISTIEDSIHGLLCTSCKGTGEVRRCDAAGQMESVPCLECKGTGVKID